MFVEEAETWQKIPNISESCQKLIVRRDLKAVSLDQTLKLIEIK